MIQRTMFDESTMIIEYLFDSSYTYELWKMYTHLKKTDFMESAGLEDILSNALLAIQHSVLKLHDKSFKDCRRATGDSPLHIQFLVPSLSKHLDMFYRQSSCMILQFAPKSFRIKLEIVSWDRHTVFQYGPSTTGCLYKLLSQAWWTEKEPEDMSSQDAKTVDHSCEFVADISRSAILSVCMESWHNVHVCLRILETDTRENSLDEARCLTWI